MSSYCSFVSSLTKFSRRCSLVLKPPILTPSSPLLLLLLLLLLPRCLLLTTQPSLSLPASSCLTVPPPPLPSLIPLVLGGGVVSEPGNNILPDFPDGSPGTEQPLLLLGAASDASLASSLDILVMYFGLVSKEWTSGCLLYSIIGPFYVSVH